MTYTHGHHDSVLRSHRWRTAENSAGYLLPHLSPGMSLLDVGCGPGTITADLARRLAPGRVVAIDAAADVVAQARRDHAEPNLRFEVADLFDLTGLPDAEPDPGADARRATTFDVVHAHQVLQHLPDPVAALRAMGAAATPGTGIVAARDADYAAMTWHPADERLDRWLDVYRRVARRNGGEPDAARHLLAWAHAAGFTDVAATTSAWCFATPEDRAWWGGMWAERITSSAIARHAVEAGDATEADLADIADAWRVWAADEDGWFAVLHGEIVCRVPTA